METELGATKRSWPGATERSQISLTVWALSSRKLTLAWTPADGEASPIPFPPFRAAGTGLSVQHSGSPGSHSSAERALAITPGLFTEVRGRVFSEVQRRTVLGARFSP